MSIEIILIGPIGSGKSTIGELLAQRLALPQYSMDKYRWRYYREISYDEEVANSKRKKEGFWGLYRYWKPFEAYAVERLLAESKNCVIDFGAGHSVFEDSCLFNRVRDALAPYPYVILLLPSADLDESIQILNDRPRALDNLSRNINEHFVRHPSNARLSKFVVYTKGKTPEETVDEIIALIH